mgnify:CR=1 FL=1
MTRRSSITNKDWLSYWSSDVSASDQRSRTNVGSLIWCCYILIHLIICIFVDKLVVCFVECVLFAVYGRVWWVDIWAAGNDLQPMGRQRICHSCACSTNGYAVLLVHSSPNPKPQTPPHPSLSFPPFPSPGTWAAILVETSHKVCGLVMN